MIRRFGTSRALLRVPPGAPSFTREIPVPRKVQTTQQVAEELGHDALIHGRDEETTNQPDLSELLPNVSAEQLKEPNNATSYFVDRSRSGNLPVYLDYNNAGGVWTEIRKISGSVPALRNDIKKALNLSKDEIWVKNAAPVIVIKGHHRKAVKKLLGEVF